MTHDQSVRPPAAEEFLRSIGESLKKNQKFLYRHARGTYEEVVELINDAIDWVRLVDKEKYAGRAMSFFLFHVFMPQAYALHVDLLSGNLPICFTELRLMVELLAKSFYADLTYSGDLSFQEKFKKLEAVLKKQRRSITDVVRLADKCAGGGGEFVALWKQLSNTWVHAGGLVNRVIHYVTNHADVPPWGLVLPMHYTESDLPELEELRQRIATFRKVAAILTHSSPLSDYA